MGSIFASPMRQVFGVVVADEGSKGDNFVALVVRASRANGRAVPHAADGVRLK